MPLVSLEETGDSSLEVLIVSLAFSLLGDGSVERIRIDPSRLWEGGSGAFLGITHIMSNIQIEEMGGSGGAPVAPAIQVITPKVGGTLYRTSPVTLNVTGCAPGFIPEIQADQGLPGVTATRETVHDGNAFIYPYQGTRIPIQGGFQFQIRRLTGWVSNPVVYVRSIAANAAGGLAVVS